MMLVPYCCLIYRSRIWHHEVFKYTITTSGMLAFIFYIKKPRIPEKKPTLCSYHMGCYNFLSQGTTVVHLFQHWAIKLHMILHRIDHWRRNTNQEFFLLAVIINLGHYAVDDFFFTNRKDNLPYSSEIYCNSWTLEGPSITVNHQSVCCVSGDRFVSEITHDRRMSAAQFRQFCTWPKKIIGHLFGWVACSEEKDACVWGVPQHEGADQYCP